MTWRSEAIEDAAKAYCAAHLTGSWEDLLEIARETCRARCAAAVDATLAVVAKHVNAKEDTTVDQHGNYFGEFGGMNHDLNQGASIAFDWVMSQCEAPA